MNNTIIDSKSNKKAFAQNHRFKKSLLTATGVVAANIMLLSISNLDLWSYHKHGKDRNGKATKKTSAKGIITVQSAKVQSAKVQSAKVQSAKVQSAVAGLSDHRLIEFLELLTVKELSNMQTVDGLIDDCLIEVLKFLTVKELSNMQSVNKNFCNNIIPYIFMRKNIKFGKSVISIFCDSSKNSNGEMDNVFGDCINVSKCLKKYLVPPKVTTISINKIYCYDLMDLAKLLSIGNLRKIHVDKLFITKNPLSLIPANIKMKAQKDREIHANKLYCNRDDLSGIDRMISYTQTDITD